MIAKVRKGSNFRGLLNYLYREGEAEAHHDPHVIGGNVIGDDPHTISEELRATTERSPRVDQSVWHASLRLAPGEHLSDAEWDLASQQFLREMGFLESDGYAPGDASYVVVRHADDHVHIVASRVRQDGSRVDVWHDWRRSHAACRTVERQHGLLNAAERSGRGNELASVSKGERLAAQRRGVEPERMRLRRVVEEARDNCDGTRGGFEAALRERGVQLRANEASSGRMSGYAYSLPGWRDREGREVWVAGSKVHRSLRWTQLEQDLEHRRRGLLQAKEAEPPPSRDALRTERDNDPGRVARDRYRAEGDQPGFLQQDARHQRGEADNPPPNTPGNEEHESPEALPEGRNTQARLPEGQHRHSGQPQEPAGAAIDERDPRPSSDERWGQEQRRRARQRQQEAQRRRQPHERLTRPDEEPAAQAKSVGQHRSTSVTQAPTLAADKHVISAEQGSEAGRIARRTREREAAQRDRGVER